MINRKQRADATKLVDYTTIADRLRAVPLQQGHSLNLFRCAKPSLSTQQSCNQQEQHLKMCQYLISKKTWNNSHPSGEEMEFNINGVLLRWHLSLFSITMTLIKSICKRYQNIVLPKVLVLTLMNTLCIGIQELFATIVS